MRADLDDLVAFAPAPVVSVALLDDMSSMEVVCALSVVEEVSMDSVRSDALSFIN